MNITPPFLVLLACTLMADAARQLTLDINGPSTNDIESLEITTILTNNGNESVNVLKEPLSPLSQLPANTLSFESEGAGQLSFVGIKAKFCDTRVGQAYDFTKFGAGDYNIGARTTFIVVNDDESTENVEVKVGSKHRVHISGKLRAIRPMIDHALDRRASCVSCSSTQQLQLVTASSAQTHAANALSYPKSITTGTNRYATWSGSFSAPESPLFALISL
ncbi:hypothetical protein BKA70DRAFT_1428089 [Coprinopsis sp. MPI-PUGE-AT-0042]|nr:hypothetical protein BKA70DRAFT_1428089 [Coprinopsis sp. MPI-PUGE-AT-0042]